MKQNESFKLYKPSTVPRLSLVYDIFNKNYTNAFFENKLISNYKT